MGQGAINLAGLEPRLKALVAAAPVGGLKWPEATFFSA